MNLNFVIDPLQTGKFYAFIYLLSFSIAFFFLLTERKRHHLPLLPWLVLTTVAFLFFIVGCQFITLSTSDWMLIFKGEKFTTPASRSVLGGILFAAPALLVATRWLKFPAHVLDSFGFVALLSLSIQRIGCMLAGCCFGTITTVPWAISYRPHSHAFVQQLSNRAIPLDAVQTLSIHPVQLYEAVGCLFILIILWSIRKYISAPGNAFVIAIFLYCVLRFFIQFFRATEILEERFFYLDVKQWVTIVVATIFISLFHYKERNQQSSSHQVRKVKIKAVLLFFFSVTLLFLLVSRWLNHIEVLAINIVLLPTLALVGWRIFVRVTVSKMRFVSALLLMGSFLMMSQTFPEYKEDVRDSTKGTYDTFSFGVMGGKSDLTYIQEDCDGNPVSSTQLDNIYSAMGAGFSRSKQISWKENFMYGINAYAGTHREKVSNAFTGTQQLTFYGVNPFFQYDRKRIGIGAGLHMGNMSKIISTYDGGFNNFSSVRQYAIFPSFSFRYGNLKKVFTEIKFANQFPTPFPVHEFQWSLGFGLEKQSVLRIGTSTFSGFFISPTIPLGKQFILEPWVGMGGGIFNTYASQQNITGAVSLHYKFNKRQK